MGLGRFHILFIVVATILAVGFGCWGLEDAWSHGTKGSLVMGIFSLAGALALIQYERWFLRQNPGGPAR